MVLVVNLNASMDKRYEIADIAKGKVIRAKHVENTPGGKGIHVANVMTILDEACIVTGFLGGKTGTFIEEKLRAYGIKQDFVKIQGETRSCLAFISDDGIQTEILEPGPEITAADQQYFIDTYSELIHAVEIVVISGSAPKNVPNDFYELLTGIAKEYGKKVFLDASGELLKNGIQAKPYFIKPNQDEVEALTGRKIRNIHDAINEIRNFLQFGIQIVVISLGADGAVIGYRDKIYKVDVPNVKAINPIGSGDAYVAGMAVAVQKEYPLLDALKFASACGTANALEEESGFVRKSVVDDLLQHIIIKEI
ncbi:1-phosphofructokinase family hexose kinase [Anaerosinus massiliensis]|uniref:1-phosphofructokinase family hexose kinase n=1 Tax=Massilibacillus massiliensis TaxID=1806837 RepID=UPI000A8C8D58|nr:1-phosphofructokinase family hexose kinase [Massilibacillus massiliensis]